MADSSSAAPNHAPSTPAPLVRVLDDEVAIQALLSRIGQRCGFDVECFGTAASFLENFDSARPGCIVLDLMLPDGSGIDVLKAVTERGSELPVVFMSGMARVSEAVQALKLGSIDFVEKPFDLQQLTAIVQRAVAMDEQRRQRVAEEDVLRQRFASLTARETQVMEQIVCGAANKEVAASLGLSHKTVEVHRANVMRKTQANSLAELVRMHVAVHKEPGRDEAPR